MTDKESRNIMTDKETPKQLTVAIPSDLVPIILARVEKLQAELGIKLSVSQVAHAMMRKGTEIVLCSNVLPGSEEANAKA